MYLFDTDTLSNLMRPTPVPPLIRKMASVPKPQQFTSAISLSELFYGAYRVGERKERLLDQIELLLFSNITVLPFDTEASRRYGSLRANLESTGQFIGDPDIRIAAIALARDLIVVTGNMRHFSRVPGLRVENWLQ
ncbi:MAG: type II toxin-antitoxin system VapC family toxin [SAR202 cluster bacterium]|nr:type II toxin-antitoxin system VapC family toxin [SAR202 cluster bacterium]